MSHCSIPNVNRTKHRASNSANEFLTARAVSTPGAWWWTRLTDLTLSKWPVSQRENRGRTVGPQHLKLECRSNGYRWSGVPLSVMKKSVHRSAHHDTWPRDFVMPLPMFPFHKMSQNLSSKEVCSIWFSYESLLPKHFISCFFNSPERLTA